MAETVSTWNAEERQRTKEHACLYPEASAREAPDDGSLIPAALNDHRAGP